MSERFKTYILGELRTALKAVRQLQENIEIIGKDLSADKIDVHTAVEQMVNTGIMRISVMTQDDKQPGKKLEPP